MKRLIKKPPKYVIDVCGYLSDSVVIEGDIQLQHPKSVKKKYRPTLEELDMWTGVIESVMTELTSRKFDIYEHHQSPRSYAYYFYFYPVTPEGEKLDAVEIRFRIADHERKELDISTASGSMMMWNFTVNDFKCESNILTLMKRVGYVCDKLKVGDYSAALLVQSNIESD